VFAAQAHRDQGGEPADHQTLGVDHTHFFVTSAGFAETFSYEEIREMEIGARMRRTARFLENGALIVTPILANVSVKTAGL